MEKLTHDRSVDLFNMGIDQESMVDLPTGEPRYAALKGQVSSHSFRTYKYDNVDGGLLVDVQTANLLVQVADALKPENRAKFLAMNLETMVSTAWKLISTERQK